MQQITVTKKNGVTLTESLTIAIYSENIVSTRTVSGLCELTYNERFDRRIKPPFYQTTNTKTVVDGFITGDVKDLTVYNLADGTTSTLTVQNKFIKDIREAQAIVNGTKTACRQVVYNKGAFISETVYVSNTLASLATAVVTTTTTTAAATTTTTTTAAATTTTTTATPTTTTTTTGA